MHIDWFWVLFIGNIVFWMFMFVLIIQSIIEMRREDSASPTDSDAPTEDPKH